MKKNIDFTALQILENKIAINILPVRSRLLGKLSKKNVDLPSQVSGQFCLSNISGSYSSRKQYLWVKKNRNDLLLKDGFDGQRSND